MNRASRSQRARKYAELKALIRDRGLTGVLTKKWNEKGSTTAYWQDKLDKYTDALTTLGDNEKKYYIRHLKEQKDDFEGAAELLTEVNEFRNFIRSPEHNTRYRGERITLLDMLSELAMVDNGRAIFPIEKHMVILKGNGRSIMIKNAGALREMIAKLEYDLIPDDAFKPVYEPTFSEGGSDPAVLIDIDNQEVGNVEVLIVKEKDYRAEKGLRNFENREGAFFPYLLKSRHLDLSKYGVFHKLNHSPLVDPVYFFQTVLNYSYEHPTSWYRQHDLDNQKLTLNQNKIYMFESFNAKRAEWMINNAEKIPEFLLYSTANERKNQTHKYENNLEHLKRFYDQYLDQGNEGGMVVEYQRYNGRGRMFARGGLSGQNIHRPVRHTLFMETHVDIDMKNAHPVIAYNFCLLKGIPCPKLKNYIENREEIMADVMALNPGMKRDQVKKVFLALLNGGETDYNKVANKPQSLIDYAKEIGTIVKAICEDYPEILEERRAKIEREKTPWKKAEYSASNIYLCEMENKILDVVLRFYDEKFGIGFNAVLCYDGIMIPKQASGEYFLKECEAQIKKELGIDMKMDVKPMDEYIDIPELLEIKNEHLEEKEEELTEEKIYERVLSLTSEAVVRYYQERSFEKDRTAPQFAAQKYAVEQYIESQTKYVYVDDEDFEHLEMLADGETIVKEVERYLRTKKTKTLLNMFDGLLAPQLERKLRNMERSNNINETGCLERALRAGGMSEDKLMKFKMMFNLRADSKYVQTSNLSDIAEELDIMIKVKTLRLTPDKKTGKIKSRIMKYGKNDNEVYDIGLLAKHYFLNDKTQYTGFSIKHHEKVKFMKNFNLFVEKKRTRYMKARVDDIKTGRCFLSSFDLIRNLLDNEAKHLTPIDSSTEGILETIYLSRVSEDFTTLRPLKSDFRKINVSDDDKEKALEERYDDVVYFDFETTTDGDVHKPFMVCATCRSAPEDIQTFYGDLSGLNFLKWLTNKFPSKQKGKKNVPQNILLKAHNLRYDLQFLIQYLSQISSYIKTGTKVKNAKGLFYNKDTSTTVALTFKDTYSFIQMPLRKFSKCFGLKVRKEVMPYEVYTNEAVKKGTFPISEALKHIQSPADQETFKQNIKDWGLETNGGLDFKHIMYCQKYCEADVRVLEQGDRTFREWMLEATKIDLDLCISLPQLANMYGKFDAVFEDVYEVAGVPRAFMQRCVEGGRVMTRNNERIMVKADAEEDYTQIGDTWVRVFKMMLQDFDAVSLYPSAMYRLGMNQGGLLKGKPEYFEDFCMGYEDLKDMDGYFVEIEITKVGKKLKFPLITYKTDEGIRKYTNEPCTMFVDKFKLEDLIKEQQIEFEVVRGYYYNNGRNDKIGKCMQKLFNLRLYHKGKHDMDGKPLDPKDYRPKNPIEQVYKLIMNSFYGKLIMKPVDKDYKFIRGEDNLYEYLQNHVNQVRYYVDIGSNLFMIEKAKPISEHFSTPQCGTEILSMSKRIMNEVMCLAEDRGFEMFYTDTDSIHIDESVIDKLSDAYREVYNRELIGTGLGQFHCDFDFDCDKGTLPVSVEAYFLGKKSYIDKIQVVKDGETHHDYHIRLKGIPNKTINRFHQTTDCFNDLHKEATPLDLYKKMFAGEEVEFDLTDVVKFKSNVNFTTSNHDSFKRRLCFNSPFCTE